MPPQYTQRMRGTLSELQIASLRDKYGNHWPVKLVNVENQLYFEEGWAKFIEDNSIETGDFMFFQYNDDKVFHVKLTGRNACDKKGVGVALLPKEMDEQENQPFHEQVDEQNEEMEQQEKQHLKKKVKRDFGKARKQLKILPRNAGKPKFENTKALKWSSKGKASAQKVAGAKRRRAKAIDHYGTDIFKSGILPVPKNPYFVTKIRPKRREELYIPCDVLKDFSIGKLPKQATLRDFNGRTWNTKLAKWNDGRKLYVGGWASFCRVNFVSDNDLCICEFVRRDQEDLVIQLQVIPTDNNAMTLS